MASTISNDRVSNKLIIEDLDLKGKCVLIRVDFNGQMNKEIKQKIDKDAVDKVRASLSNLGDVCSKSIQKKLDKAKTKHFEIYLQIDFIVTNDYLDLDIGQQSIEKPFCEAIKQAKTIIWNYSTGVFEHDQFANGTQKKYLRLLLNKPNNIL
ncbi:unnamed protein product [Rotaria sp. Silwood2]|nr:unnamed protein product [Rotaria sp. Silwood2]CAF4208945.1 unnamed protein product [Rotaria sp. Silwood2]